MGVAIAQDIQSPTVAGGARGESAQRPGSRVMIPNLHDRRALEAIVERLDTEAIAECLDEGGLSEFARDVVAAELARRVLADGGDHVSRARPPVWWFVDRALGYLPVGYLLWVVLVSLLWVTR